MKLKIERIVLYELCVHLLTATATLRRPLRISEEIGLQRCTFLFARIAINFGQMTTDDALQTGLRA